MSILTRGPWLIIWIKLVESYDEATVNVPSISIEEYEIPFIIVYANVCKERKHKEVLIKHHNRIQETGEQANARNMELYVKFWNTGLPLNSIHNPDLNGESAIESIKRTEKFDLRQIITRHRICFSNSRIYAYDLDLIETWFKRWMSWLS